MKNTLSKKIKFLTCLCLVFAMFIGLFANETILVDAKSKRSTKRVTTLYDADGKAYKPGSTIPASKLNGLKFKLYNVNKNRAYEVTFVFSDQKWTKKETGDHYPGSFKMSTSVFNSKSRTSIAYALLNGGLAYPMPKYETVNASKRSKELKEAGWCELGKKSYVGPLGAWYSDTEDTQKDVMDYKLTDISIFCTQYIKGIGYGGWSESYYVNNYKIDLKN